MDTLREGVRTSSSPDSAAKFKSELRTRVERGATWLDKVAPGWESKIDHQTLDIRHSHVCICGQVGVWSLVNMHDLAWASDHGLFLAAGFKDYDREYAELTNEWLALLVERVTPASGQRSDRSVDSQNGIDTRNDSKVKIDKKENAHV